MLEHMKITFSNDWYLNCAFTDRGNIRKLKLGYEIHNKSKIILENDFKKQKIDYPSIMDGITFFKNLIAGHLLYTNENNDHLEGLLYDVLYNDIIRDVFSFENRYNPFLIEMRFRLEGDKTIGYLKNKTSTLFEGICYVESFNNNVSGNVKNHDDKCYDFLLKIKLK